MIVGLTCMFMKTWFLSGFRRSFVRAHLLIPLRLYNLNSSILCCMKNRSDITSENEWVRILQSGNYPVLLKRIFVCYLYCFAFLTHLRLLSWFPFKLFKLLNALWPRPMASNNSMNLIFKSLHEVNSKIRSEHAWLLLIICSKHCFVPIINIYMCISKSTFWFQSNLVICSVNKLVRCYSLYRPLYTHLLIRCWLKF